MKKLCVFLIVFALLMPLISFVFKDFEGSGDSALEKEDAPSKENEIDFSKLTYVAFGDSITYGADYTRNYAQMDNPYPKLVSEKLKLSSVKNLGVSGATFVANDLNRVCMTDNILSFDENADIISVMLGVNDYACSLPLGTITDTSNTTIYGSLNLIAKHLTTVYKDSFVFFMTPYKTTYNSNSEYQLIDVVKAVKEVADLYDISVLDMYNLGKYELEMYNASSDGIHPSQDFITTYTAPQIAEFIKQNYKQGK